MGSFPETTIDPKHRKMCVSESHLVLAFLLTGRESGIPYSYFLLGESRGSLCEQRRQRHLTHC